MNGKMHGVDSEWHLNGKKAEESIYVDGVLRGKVTRWFADGSEQPASLANRNDDYRDAYVRGWEMGDTFARIVQVDSETGLRSAREAYNQYRQPYAQILNGAARAGRANAENVQSQLQTLRGGADGIRDRLAEAGISVD